MSIHRRAANKDANQSQVVELFRKYGCSVQVLSAKDVPDLLVGVSGETFLVEVKDGSKKPSARKLSEGQLRWCQTWRGGPIYVVERLEQVPTVIAMATKRREDA